MFDSQTESPTKRAGIRLGRHHTVLLRDFAENSSLSPENPTPARDAVPDAASLRSCCGLPSHQEPFATPAIWIIVWLSSAIAAPTQMQRCMRCCSTSSSRSRRPSSPWRSSPAPCLAGLHERTRAIDLEKRRHSVANPFARRFDPRALPPLHIQRRSAPTLCASAATIARSPCRRSDSWRLRLPGGPACRKRRKPNSTGFPST
jgi:hypothetical protein